MYCALSFWVAPIWMFMTYKVTYLLNAYDIFTSFILNINQTCKINFAYRLWKVIYLFISMKYNVKTIIISSMNAIIWKHGLRNQKVICCMSMIFMFPFYQTYVFYTKFSSSLLSQGTKISQMKPPSFFVWSFKTKSQFTIMKSWSSLCNLQLYDLYNKLAL
jgi:hypothetical protein